MKWVQSVESNYYNMDVALPWASIPSSRKQKSYALLFYLGETSDSCPDRPVQDSQNDKILTLPCITACKV